MADVAAPGHRLGQMIGNFVEGLVAKDLAALCSQYGYYCDRKGLRPKVRGKRKKVTWKDKYGNPHDLDYVVEKDGTYDVQGIPVAFIELAWRRYTKHSINKSGEIGACLVDLRDTYRTCGFLGAIVAGDYTTGGKNQLASHGINVLHIPFGTLVDRFKEQGVNLHYPQKASHEAKQAILDQWEALPEESLNAIAHSLRKAIAGDYSAFRDVLEKSLSRRVESIAIMPLYGNELLFHSIADAAHALKGFDETAAAEASFAKYEIQIRFNNGEKVEGTFLTKATALHFLSLFV